jgi:recombination protein RecA
MTVMDGCWLGEKMTALAMAEKVDTHMSAEAEKMLKAGTLRMGNDPSFNLTKISTGLPRLDAMLGGGMIRGRYVELVGEFSSGKSFLCLRAIKAAQDAGLTVALIDTESTYDEAWCKRIGIDTEKLIVSSQKIGEDVIDTVALLLRERIDLIVVDSLMGMVPTIEMEEDAHTEQRQLHPKLISKAIRKWHTSNTHSALMLVNHIRDMENVPGGYLQGYYASAILRVKRSALIKKGVGMQEVVSGFTMRIILRKSKQSKAWTRMEIPFMYEGLLDEIGGDVDFAIDSGIIRRSGAYYNYGDIRFHGREAVTDYFRDNKDEHRVLLSLLKSVPEVVDEEE